MQAAAAKGGYKGNGDSVAERLASTGGCAYSISSFFRPSQSFTVFARFIRVWQGENSIGFEGLVGALALASVLKIEKPLTKLRGYLDPHWSIHSLAGNAEAPVDRVDAQDRKSTRLNFSHLVISYA